MDDHMDLGTLISRYVELIREFPETDGISWFNV